MLPRSRNENAQSDDRKCFRQHNRACGPREGGQPLKFYSAAHDGCEACVRYYVETEQVDPLVETDAGRTNALLWAVHGRDSGLDTEWVRGFLQGRGVKLPGEPPPEAAATGSTEQAMPDRNRQQPLSEEALVQTYGIGKEMLDRMRRLPLSHRLHGSRLHPQDRRGLGHSELMGGCS